MRRVDCASECLLHCVLRVRCPASERGDARCCELYTNACVCLCVSVCVRVWSECSEVNVDVRAADDSLHFFFLSSHLASLLTPPS